LPDFTASYARIASISFSMAASLSSISFCRSHKAARSPLRRSRSAAMKASKVDALSLMPTLPLGWCRDKVPPAKKKATGPRRTG
jgi:hypothetical protein